MEPVPPHLRDLMWRIRELREKLRQLGPASGLNDPRVLAMSRQIDVLIVEFMRQTEDRREWRKFLEPA